MKLKKRAVAYNRTSAFDVLLVILMILFMATILLPFVHIIAVSFSGKIPVTNGEVGLWPKDFTLSTYKRIFENGDFFIAYGNTIYYTVVHTFLSLLLTAMGAYALARRQMVGHRLFSLMITVTMFFGGGLIPTYMAVSNYKLIDTRWAMILPSVISVWNLIVMRSFFVAYPQEIVESGKLVGLEEPGVFFRLVLPTSKAALATIGLYYAVATWNSYMPARLYIRDTALYPVQHLLQQMLTSANLNELNDAAEEIVLVPASLRYASIMIATIPIMCVYPFIQKYFVKGVMVGSIKG